MSSLSSFQFFPIQVPTSLLPTYLHLCILFPSSSSCFPLFLFLTHSLSPFFLLPFLPCPPIIFPISFLLPFLHPKLHNSSLPHPFSSSHPTTYTSPSVSSLSPFSPSPLPPTPYVELFFSSSRPTTYTSLSSSSLSFLPLPSLSLFSYSHLNLVLLFPFLPSSTHTLSSPNR